MFDWVVAPTCHQQRYRRWREGRADRKADPVHELQPYVPAAVYMPVTAVVRGEHCQGHVLGWRGKRVYLQWTPGPGLNHLAWVPAADVERC